MAGYAGGVHGGAARRIDAPGDSQQGRSVEFRAVHVFEYSARRGALGKTRHDIVGTAAADGLRRLGAGARGFGGTLPIAIVVCRRSAHGMVARLLRAVPSDVGRGATANTGQD